MKKNKIFKRILTGLFIYAIAFVVVLTLFNRMLNDPIDTIAIDYLRYETNISDEYGEIIHIGKNIAHKTQKEKVMIKSPYTVETEIGRVVVYVTLVESDGEWKAISFEIIKVIPNE